MAFFVALRRTGPSGIRALRLEQQSDWKIHADLMDALVEEGFVVLGGPLADEHRVVLGGRGRLRGRSSRDARPRSLEPDAPPRRLGRPLDDPPRPAARRRLARWSARPGKLPTVPSSFGATPLSPT